MTEDLKEAILGIEVTQFDGQKADLEELVNPKQLEKVISDWMPEVLSQEWIDEHVDYADVRGGTQSFVRVDDLQNILVPKQELPVIPKFVADYIDDRKEIGFPIYQSIRVVREDSRFEDSHLREWLWTNKGQETFARAWLNGYEIEEEPLYYVMKDGVVILSKIDEYHQLDKSRWIGAVTNKEYIKENPDKVRFTEQEIKDYDERFWAFAVPVEEVQNDTEI